MSVATQPKKNPAAEPPLFADQALAKLLSAYQFNTVLDIGCGTGRHSQKFREAGKDVTGVDIVGLAPGVIVADYLKHNFDRQFDCAWASHVLEHQPNVNLFLRKVHGDLRDGGVLAVTVPPLKHNIVGGHLTLWNAGLLLYNLVLAGFDCRQARVKHYGYNISVIVQKTPANIPYDKLKYDSGDIDTLAPFFPQHPKLPIQQSFNGDIRQLHWDGNELQLNVKKTLGRRLGRLLSKRYWFPA